jgi:hypothetical protein
MWRLYFQTTGLDFGHNGQMIGTFVHGELCASGVIAIQIMSHVCCSAQLDELLIEIEVNTDVQHDKTSCKFTI